MCLHTVKIDERKEVDEPSHAERSSRAIPPPELRPLPWLLPPRRRPKPHQHPMRLPRLHHRCHPHGDGGGRHPPHFFFAATPTVAFPAVVTVAASLFPPVFVLKTLRKGFGQNTGWGSSSWAGVWGKAAGWERREKKLWRKIYCWVVPAANSSISAFQLNAIYRP